MPPPAHMLAAIPFGLDLSYVRESSLQVPKATYSGLQEHRIIEYAAKGRLCFSLGCLGLCIVGAWYTMPLGRRKHKMLGECVSPRGSACCHQVFLVCGSHLCNEPSPRDYKWYLQVGDTSKLVVASTLSRWAICPCPEGRLA
jgi:hypothetical protein